MDKTDFITKLEQVKTRLPVAAVPLYMMSFSGANLSRVKNTLAGKIRDEKILSNLEKLAETIENI